MGAALDDLRGEMQRVSLFAGHARVVTDHFGREATEKRDIASALRAGTPGPAAPVGAPAIEAEALAAKNEARQTDEARAEWQRDIARTYILRLVTAFEVFLRQLIIEKACGDEALVRSFIRSRGGLQLDPPLALGAPAQVQERISACVDETCKTFSNLEQVNAYFTYWFGEGAGFLSQERLAPPLSTATAKTAAVADLAILLQLHHVLIHKSGVPNAKYHAVLASDRCRPRLHPSALVATGAAPQAASPDDVLASPGVYRHNAAKQDDLYQSLLNLAEHIDALYG